MNSVSHVNLVNYLALILTIIITQGFASDVCVDDYWTIAKAYTCKNLLPDETTLKII